MARPRGSYTRPQIKDYIGNEDIIELTNLAVKKAKGGDVVLLKFLLEQVYGKAPQPLTGNDGEVLQIVIKRYEEDIDKGGNTT
jgi:hypothetical protein